MKRKVAKGKLVVKKKQKTQKVLVKQPVKSKILPKQSLDNRKDVLKIL